MAEALLPTAQQSALLAELPADEPVVMINLLRFNKPNGAARYVRYAREVQPHLQAVGTKALDAGTACAHLIGEEPRACCARAALMSWCAMR
jgi:hypothetical protein